MPHPAAIFPPHPSGRSASDARELELKGRLTMPINRLQQLHDAGQSIWLDSIDRRILHDGELDRRIRDDALTGMTSNPTIFQKALASSNAYDEQIAEGEEQGLSTWQLFEMLETTDVRDACDHFAGVFSATRGNDGTFTYE
jgi:transaldolase